MSSQCCLLQQVFTKTKDGKNSDFAWDRMPLELRPNWKRKKEVVGPRKKVKVVNIEETLKVLEEKEKVKVPEVVEKESDADENDEVPYLFGRCNRIVIHFIFYRKNSKSTTKKWMKITITVTAISTMVMHTMKKTTIWTMDRYTKDINTCHLKLL